MGALILGCGGAVTSADWAILAATTGSLVRETPATPGRADLDPLLKGLSGEDVVVHGSDADLAAVVLRLLRLDRLDVRVGYVPTSPTSPVARLWRLPADRVRAALAGSAHPVPLIRDDVGGVLLGLGVLAPVNGTVFCDDAVPLRGTAKRVEVAPDPAGGPGLSVTVVRRAFLRDRRHTWTGRAVQFGSDPVVPVRDGVPHPRPMTRWTWYRHTQDLLVVR
ncbi:hypothetical protein [Actinophytocola xanthii]|uniref:Uncharacterized protein n=1 Tax=Actinophytocola xanthii TaxID=1912961 RepID=A0A1Q8CG08_9PSEU|nr:hypothetical protein [Actinophytocola xanthii]OLF13263.1 hypothetical protein BU204_28215 [Actinophytocola xanthii]